MLRHSQQHNGGAVLTPYYTDIIFVLCLSIPAAFTHTRCISPSVTAFLFFIRRATSLLRGRRGRSRAMHRVNAALHSAFRIPHSEFRII